MVKLQKTFDCWVCIMLAITVVVYIFESIDTTRRPRFGSHFSRSATAWTA